MPKRYRLLKDHPYAIKGTIVNDAGRTGKELSVVDPAYPFRLIWVPILVESDWLEEVKEEVTCSKDFANDLKYMIDYWLSDGKPNSLVVVRNWIDNHTSNEE